MASKTYIPLYRGLLEHATGMSDPAWKLYTVLLMACDHRTGVYAGSTDELAALVGKSPETVRRLVRELSAHYVTKTRDGLAITRYKTARRAVGDARERRMDAAAARIEALDTDYEPADPTRVRQGMEKLEALWKTRREGGKAAVKSDR